ncbi:MAG: methylated-DNA--[protein]-cysteine S-methyltransferase [Thiohalophilus sp.]
MTTSCFQVTVPPGILAVTLSGELITAVDLPARARKQLPGPTRPLEKRLAAGLKAYFVDAAAPLDWPLQFEGTDFQQRVWRALRAIPAGTVKTYGQLAAEIGGCAQAVGNACRQNPIPLYIPCHRVVARQGIGGFAGKTAGQSIRLKRWLLLHEGVALRA